jgi:hypothetical protein
MKAAASAASGTVLAPVVGRVFPTAGGLLVWRPRTWVGGTETAGAMEGAGVVGVAVGVGVGVTVGVGVGVGGGVGHGNGPMTVPPEPDSP